MDEFRPFRGNVFQELDLNPDGSVKNVDSLGRIRYRDVTPENAANRRNYNKAYYINHLMATWHPAFGLGRC